MKSWCHMGLMHMCMHTLAQHLEGGSNWVVQVTKKYWRLWLSLISITQSSGNSSPGMIQPFRHDSDHNCLVSPYQQQHD